MNPQPITPRPAPFDLGNLFAVKVGDEMAALDAAGRVGSSVLLVRAIHAWGVQVRLPDSPHVIGSWRHENGGGYPWAMHDQNVMRGYFSANPVHIAQAKANAEAARIEREAKAAAFETQMVLARPIGLELGDRDADSDGIAQELANRLTPEQLATLAGWLHLTP